MVAYLRCYLCGKIISGKPILVSRGRAPFVQHQESRPLARSSTGSPRFTDFPSLCACSESSVTNLIGSGLNLLCIQSHLKLECRWTEPEVAILGADQKERGFWGREWGAPGWWLYTVVWACAYKLSWTFFSRPVSNPSKTGKKRSEFKYI